MRFVFLGLVALMTVPALASECYVGSAEAISLGEWDIEVISEATHRVSLQLTSSLDKPVRMANVEAGFYDILGNHIGGFRFEPDFKIGPRETVDYQREIGAQLMPRLPKVAREDVAPYFCTTAVIYDDGTVEKFD